MASEVTICNLALSHLGDSATVASIDPPEGSAQAEHCSLFYPVARNALLEMHNWKFATRRAVLAATSEDSFGWAYAYSAPAGVIKLLAVLPYDADSDDETQNFEVEGGTSSDIILTNQENAVVRFTSLVTDTTRFSALFTEALARLLSSYLAGPIYKGETGVAMAKSCYQMFMVAYARAVASDSNQRKVRPDHTPAWIENR